MTLNSATLEGARRSIFRGERVGSESSCANRTQHRQLMSGAEATSVEAGRGGHANRRGQSGRSAHDQASVRARSSKSGAGGVFDDISDSRSTILHQNASTVFSLIFITRVKNGILARRDLCHIGIHASTGWRLVTIQFCVRIKHAFHRGLGNVSASSR